MKEMAVRVNQPKDLFKVENGGHSFAELGECVMFSAGIAGEEFWKRRSVGQLRVVSDNLRRNIWT